MHAPGACANGEDSTVDEESTTVKSPLPARPGGPIGRRGGPMRNVVEGRRPDA